MEKIKLRKLTEKENEELLKLYDKTKDVRIKSRAQMIILAKEQKMIVQEIVEIVRASDQTIRRWIKRFNAEGINGLYDMPRPGTPKKMTSAYRERLLEIVRRRPRTLEQSYSMWTLARLADFMAEETGLRVSTETVRRILKSGGIVLSRPQHTISSPDPEYKVKKKRLKWPEIT